MKGRPLRRSVSCASSDVEKSLIPPGLSWRASSVCLWLIRVGCVLGASRRTREKKEWVDRWYFEQVIQTEKEMEAALDRICDQLLRRHPQLSDVVLVGTNWRRVPGRTVKTRILQRGRRPSMGIIDIALYRDDWTRLSQTPEVKRTEIVFPVQNKHVLLVDDVLFTGRTIRAGFDALLDLGRPRRVELAVLIDRGHGSCPFAPILWEPCSKRRRADPSMWS